MFLLQAFTLHRDPLTALYAATRVVRQTVPDTIPYTSWDLGFGYDTSSPYFDLDISRTLGDSGFGALGDDANNQISHFIAEAYISLYQLETGGGRIGGQILIYGNELTGFRDTHHWNQDDVNLGLIANQFANDIWTTGEIGKSLTTAISSIRNFFYYRY